jgi:hypothetical protein
MSLPTKPNEKMKAGLNGNTHGALDVQERLTDLGVEYLGDGEWNLPEGAEMVAVGADDWQLTLADGTEYAVWSEE